MLNLSLAGPAGRARKGLGGVKTMTTDLGSVQFDEARGKDQGDAARPFGR